MDDSSVRGVILDVDFPGGEVGGLFDLVERMRPSGARALSRSGRSPTEVLLSAAYAIASAADRLYVTRTGEVGSIGVVAVHVDESGADAKAGLAWTFVFAGDQKVDANAHEPLSQRARATIQALDVHRFYAELCALVAANRGISIETARNTNAAIYRGATCNPRRPRRSARHARHRRCRDGHRARSARVGAYARQPDSQEETFHGDEPYRTD